MTFCCSSLVCLGFWRPRSRDAVDQDLAVRSSYMDAWVIMSLRSINLPLIACVSQSKAHLSGCTNYCLHTIAEKLRARSGRMCFVVLGCLLQNKEQSLDTNKWLGNSQLMCNVLPVRELCLMTKRDTLRLT